MASNDIRRFFFYQEYLWQPTDFDNFQTWLDSTIAALAEGAHGASVLSGLNVIPSGGLNLQIDSGIAVNGSGRPIYVPTTQNATVASDVSNPSRHLIVLRPVDTNTTLIDKPTDPLTQVPLHKILTYSVVVIAGTPAATPQYPAIQAGDIVIMGVKVAAGQATLTQDDMDRSQVNTRRKHIKALRQIASAYTINVADEILEVAATGGAVTALLPPASTCPGLEFAVIKIDSSANQVAVSGQGGELISGQSSQMIDDQWGSIKMYSTGVAWRIF